MFLVADKKTLINLKKRTRTLPQMAAAFATAKVPPVYLFNVGPRSFQRPGPRGTVTIPACLPGEPHSEAVKIDGLVLSEYNLGDAGGAMGTTADPALDGVDDEGRPLFGVADDVIGKHSSSPELGLQTSNLEWFGVFATSNETPTAAELKAANGKLTRMMQLIYEDGAGKLRQNDPGHLDASCRMQERALYNDAAKFLNRPLLWGSEEHALARCPECQEPIMSGATFCKHCSQAIDPASVLARANKRAKANAELS